jgi:hypothetical protein
MDNQATVSASGNLAYLARPSGHYLRNSLLLATQLADTQTLETMENFPALECFF